MFSNLSDEDLLSQGDAKDPRRSKSSIGHSRRESKDDAWVDILVGAQRRMNDQAAELRALGNRRPPVKRRSLSDPELVREEIAQALMAAGPEPSEDDDPRLSQDHAHDDTQELTDDEDIYGPQRTRKKSGRRSDGTRRTLRTSSRCHICARPRKMRQGFRLPCPASL